MKTSETTAFKVYAVLVAEKLGVTVEQLLESYGDMIEDCYETPESVEACVEFCKAENDYYSGKDRRPL